MGFESLPSHQLNIPEFRPAQIPAPPVYDTSKTLHQLNALMEHFSPEARAKRKAAVARMNYEYDQYKPGGRAERQANWAYEVQRMRRDEHNARMKRIKEGGYRDPDSIGASLVGGWTPRPESSIDYQSSSTPPSTQEGEE